MDGGSARGKQTGLILFNEKNRIVHCLVKNGVISFDVILSRVCFLDLCIIYCRVKWMEICRNEMGHSDFMKGTGLFHISLKNIFSLF